MTTFLQPASDGQSEYMEKRSRFIGRVLPVESEEEARAKIEETKRRHYDARHNCWCYFLRDGTARYSDDGEPQGTAGQPMLGVFQGGGITNVCCVVTRYFGGVLLGTGGLVRAYSAAAKQALDASGVCEMAQWRQLTLTCAYGQYERVKRLLEDGGAVVEDTDYAADVTLYALLREDVADAFSHTLADATAGSVRCDFGETCFRGVRIR